MPGESVEKTVKTALEFIAELAPRTEAATVVTLSGELGAGKTTFVQGIARALGVAEPITSPTFVIEKIYSLEGQKWKRLIHIDAYRLADARELAALGWQEIVADPENLVCIEWPEHVAALIPADAARLHLDIEGEKRIIRADG